MDYRHFIITRFNLRNVSKGDGKDKSGNSVLTGDWLAHRLEIFNKYCLPSLVNQTNKNFTWLLYFDITTSPEVREINKQLENQYPDLIKIIYTDGQEGLIKGYRQDILALCPPETKFVISTRFDNDDIVHKDFINKIQDSFSYQDFETVNFLKILMINPDLKNKIHIDYSFSNHFISLIEKITPEGIKGCFYYADRGWGAVASIQITDHPYCMEIISDKNLVNDFRGIPVFRKTDLSDFQLNYSLRNSFFDRYNFMIWKMSVKRLLLSLKYKKI